MSKQVEHCLKHVKNRSGGTSGVSYLDQCDCIHLDEKWFCRTSIKRKFHLGPNEECPDRKARHKIHIDKIMFMAAISRPRLINGIWWDGEIGIWPFGQWIPAKRDSIDRPAGTACWFKETCDRDTHREMMRNCVVLAICAEWPDGACRNQHLKIHVQQDSAPGHFNETTDTEWISHLKEMELSDKLVLHSQPAQSPDLNLCDLGLCNAIQSDCNKITPWNHRDIIDCVTWSHHDCPHEKVKHLWLTHMSVMNAILDCDGNNNHKLPHMNKAKLEREGRSPEVLPITEAAKRHFDACQAGAPAPPLPPLSLQDEAAVADAVNGVI
jgi:hypothetical protein